MQLHCVVALCLLFTPEARQAILMIEEVPITVNQFCIHLD